MTFGEKIQILRRQKGLSQEQLADELLVSRQAVSKWELDSSLPDTAKIIQLSKLFGVSTDYLLIEDAQNDAGILVMPKVPVETERKSGNVTTTLFAAICTGIGALGSITLFVLSTMIQVPVTKEKVLADGSVKYYGGGDVLGYSFFGFIEQYRLPALLIIFILLLFAGVTTIVMKKSK